VTVTRRTLEKSGYRRFLDPWTIAKAGRYMAENRDSFTAAEKAYGVPAEVVAAILLVETKLGSYLGDREAFGVLASMALCSDFELVRTRLKNLKNSPERTAFAKQAAKDKGDWAYAEFKALLAYATAKKTSPLAIPGSVYGAIGICQFMPTNALKFGVDADKDGTVDLFAEADAIHSVANYLRGHGWKAGQTEEERRAAIYSYNHSNLYVMAVLTVAEKLTPYRPAS
jgi:membrane-bound lytic murein transglycosylase B